MSRSINYTSSPLLASKTPVWRSKFIVAGLALAFAGLAGRAAYVQVLGNDFFQRQGEVRFARTLELPAWQPLQPLSRKSFSPIWTIDSLVLPLRSHAS